MIPIPSSEMKHHPIPKRMLIRIHKIDPKNSLVMKEEINREASKLQQSQLVKQDSDSHTR